MTDQFTDAAEDIAAAITPAKGVYIPKRIATSIVAAIIIGGIGVPAYIAKEITNQGRQMIQINERLDSTKELMIQMVRSQEARLSRVENRVYGSNP